jgi:primosomal protein N' (replication factor Y)
VHKNILRIAVPSPLYRSFDYLLPAGVEPHALQAGVRVRVPFGRRTVIGVLLAVTTESLVATHKLKHALAVLDTDPVLNSDVLSMVQWASDYYHHPIGDALTAALPVLLRHGKPPEVTGTPAWRLTAAGQTVDAATLARAPRQQAVMSALREHSQGLARSALDASASVLRTLEEKGWIEAFCQEPTTDSTATTSSAHTLNPAQQHAVDAILEQYGQFSPFLLEGVTGSGKTEVYLTLWCWSRKSA